MLFCDSRRKNTRAYLLGGLLSFVVCKGVLGYGLETLSAGMWKSFIFLSYVSLILHFVLYYFLGFWVVGFLRDLEVEDGNRGKQSHRKFFYGTSIFIGVLPVFYYGYTWIFGFYPSWYASWGAMIVICSGMAGRLLIKEIKSRKRLVQVTQNILP